MLLVACTPAAATENLGLLRSACMLSAALPGQNQGCIWQQDEMGLGLAAAVKVGKHLVPTPTMQHMACDCCLTPDSSLQSARCAVILAGSWSL